MRDAFDVTQHGDDRGDAEGDTRGDDDDDVFVLIASTMLRDRGRDRFETRVLAFTNREPFPSGSASIAER